MPHRGHGLVTPSQVGFHACTRYKQIICAVTVVSCSFGLKFSKFLKRTCHAGYEISDDLPLQDFERK